MIIFCWIEISCIHFVEEWGADLPCERSEIRLDKKMTRGERINSDGGARLILSWGVLSYFLRVVLVHLFSCGV